MDAAIVGEGPALVRPWSGRADACVVVAFVAVCAATVTAMLLRLHVVAGGGNDPGAPLAEMLVYGSAMAASVVVGGIVAHRRPDHPVGWLFLGLGVSFAVAALLDEWSATALGGRDPLPGAAAAAVVSGATFVPWFVLVALVLQLTPTGQPLSRRWGRIARATVVAGLATIALKLVQTKPLEPPFASVTNPWGLGRLSVVVDPLEAIAVTATGLGLIAAAVSLFVRFRRSRGMERRQLLWLGTIAVFMPLVIVAAFAGSSTHHPLVTTLATGVFVAGVPAAAALSVLRFHLYDVDRILSRATAYVLLTLLALGAYAATAVAVALSLGRLAGRSQAAAVAATLVAVAVVAPAHRRVRDAVDRRFNRRRFDALAIVHAHVRDRANPAPVDDALREALGDPHLEVAYWVPLRELWVRADGRPAVPGDSDVRIAREGVDVAAVSFDTHMGDRPLVEAVVDAAAPSLEAIGLRAALALELAEVQASRSRIVAAEMAERRRIERNLHDGAQQRLLALAFQLRAVEMSGDGSRALAAVGASVGELREAIAELRELAGGLHPSILVDGGLTAAFDDLVGRTPLPVTLRVSNVRLEPDVETAAWYIACEAVANAVKHAAATQLTLSAECGDGQLVLTIADNGIGGADPRGSGLQGIADRADALDGTLSVGSPLGRGTVITAVLPCVL